MFSVIRWRRVFMKVAHLVHPVVNLPVGGLQNQAHAFVRCYLSTSADSVKIRKRPLDLLQDCQRVGGSVEIAAL